MCDTYCWMSSSETPRFGTIDWKPYCFDWLSWTTTSNGDEVPYNEECVHHQEGQPFVYVTTDTFDVPNNTSFTIPSFLSEKRRGKYVHSGHGPRVTDTYGARLVSYESVDVVLMDIWVNRGKFPKDIRTYPAFSRDGYHTFRPIPHVHLVYDKHPHKTQYFVAGGGFVATDDHIVMMASYTHHDGAYLHTKYENEIRRIRRDGFVSAYSLSSNARLRTRMMMADKCRYLFINIDASLCPTRSMALYLKLNTSDHTYTSIGVPCGTNATKLMLMWADLGSRLPLDETPFRIDFYFPVSHVHLYSFWCSEYQSGESKGWVSGGYVGRGLQDVPLVNDAPLNYV